MLTVEAPAKINLSLEVLGKRPDGYHDLVSVMQTVTLFDTLRLEPAEDVFMTCSDPHLSTDDNLVMRAIQLVRSRYDLTQGCSVHLEKRIPVAAGLGGGSSDAAAALIGFARLCRIQDDCAAFVDMAAQLGSDVPFFLYGGTALVEGRGEHVSPLARHVAGWYLLVKPRLGIQSSSVFAALPSTHWTSGDTTRTLACSLASGRVAGIGINGLQQTVCRLHPQVGACLEMLQSIAPDRAILSGSGPTVAAHFSSQQEAEQAEQMLAKQDVWTRIVTTNVPPGREAACS